MRIVVAVVAFVVLATAAVVGVGTWAWWFLTPGSPGAGGGRPPVVQAFGQGSSETYEIERTDYRPPPPPARNPTVSLHIK